jgi:beta-glucuronidase
VSATASPSSRDAGWLIQNPFARKHLDLGGRWRVIVDPRSPSIHPPLPGRTIDGLIEGRTTGSGLELLEYAFDDSVALETGRDWNTQAPRLFFYESVVWYRRDFEARKEPGRRYLLHFGAVNYRAEVWLNGVPLGVHEGGYTPFALDATEALKPGANFLIVKADARLDADTAPPLMTDWWNYGGLKREVLLLDLPFCYLHDYWLSLEDHGDRRVRARFRLSEVAEGVQIALCIPELGETVTAASDAKGQADIAFRTAAELWSPASPKLYEVEIICGSEIVRDRIGFRTVERTGGDILLNGRPIFLKGISTHEESPLHDGSAFGAEDARATLGLAKELGANFIRLAHYPHNEFVTRLADELGLLVWSEIPVYWQVAWENPAVLDLAQAQLREMIERDRNRASVIVWSVANETPPTPERLRFLSTLVEEARSLDGTRLVSAAIYGREADLRAPVVRAIRACALLDPTLPEDEKAPIRERLVSEGVDPADGAALERMADAPHLLIDDPLLDLLDIAAFNEYFGWYTAMQWAHTVPISESRMARILLELMPEIALDPKSDKPLVITEFGADAKAGFKGDDETMMSERYQARLYGLQIRMLARSRKLRGLSPWVLKDFRSPLRTHPVYQQYFNRKGLVDETGRRKAAFAILQDLYARTEPDDGRSVFEPPEGEAGIAAGSPTE